MRLSTAPLAIGALCAAFAAVSRAQAQDDPPPADDSFAQARMVPGLDAYAPKILPGAKRAEDREPVLPAKVMPGILQTGRIDMWPRLFHTDDLLVTGSLTATAGLFAMGHNNFAPPPSLLPAGTKINPAWGEFFVEPGITARYKFSPALSVYGEVSYLESATRGQDYTTVTNTYHGDTELLYAGATFSHDAATTLDVSYGQQEYTIGNGMLLWSGATNGAQRGAAYVGPRAAWANALLVKAAWPGVAAQAFYLKPNEAPAAATGTRIVGVNADWTPPGPLQFGALYAYVPQSAIVTREGLNVYDLRGRWHPFTALPGAWVQGEYAWERKPGVAANGWYVQGNYNAQDLAWKPLFAVQYTSLSGARPGAAQWRGFDPLYFGNGNPNWYQGKIGSTIFNNTNLDTASVTVTLTPTDKQILQFWYLAFAADEVNSPLGAPAVGAPPVGGGVPARALANEFDASYTYTFNKSVNINVFGGYAAPGAGYKTLYASAGGSAQGWWLLGMQLNLSY